MSLENIFNEDLFDILESYLDRMNLSGEERANERVRVGLALLAYCAELAGDIEEAKRVSKHYLSEVEE